MKTKSIPLLKIHIYLFLLLFSGFLIQTQAFCHPGCNCEDELKEVVCENVTNIPILLHPMLKSLTLRSCKSLKLDAVSIGLYQELELLDLSDNNIAELPHGFLQSLKKLKTLRLSGNMLKVIDENLVGAGKLQELQMLDLSRNQLERIVPEVFSGLEQLSALNLSHNQLYLLQPTAFSGLAKHLKNLDLSKNRFARLTTGFFNETPALTDLNLAGNIFSELPSSLFSAQRRLSKLDLSSNLLTSIDPQAFSGLYSLKELDLARNLLPSIEQGGLSSNWNYLPDLQMIDLSGNSIKQIDENAFQGLFSLKELRLKDMPALTHVQENGFAGLSRLERLEMSGCPVLTQLHPNVFGHHHHNLPSLSLNQRGGGNLKHLDLSYNQLSTLDSKLLDWQHLKWLNLAGNRWDCSCKMLEFLPAILRESQGGPAYCTLPDQLFNVQIKDIKSPRACNNSINDPLFTLLSLAAFLTILTLLTLLLLLCCCRHQNSGKLLSKCCSPSSSSNNQSRLPLYNTGSSFTESLIYEKGNVPLAKPPKSDPLIPNFTATIPRNMGVISNTEDSEGYYYSILPLGAGMNQASSQSTLRIGQLPNCQIAHAPYLLHNRSMVGLNRVLSNGYSRPPSFTAPPPPPVDLDRSRERLDEEGFEEMDDGYAARRYRTRSTEVV